MCVYTCTVHSIPFQSSLRIWLIKWIFPCIIHSLRTNTFSLYLIGYYLSLKAPHNASNWVCLCLCYYVMNAYCCITSFIIFQSTGDMYASIINPLQRQHYKKIGKCLAEMPAIAKIRGNVYGRVHGTLNFINHFSIFNWNNFRLNYDHYNTIHARRIDHTIYNCCPGWTKISKHSHGCTKRKNFHFVGRN